MKKGWNQTWKNLLFQHFEIKNINTLKKHLPKNCTFDNFEGKYYLGLVAMSMTNVKHKAFPNIKVFKDYNELNVRTYILHNEKPGVLFISLDVNSFISVLGANIFYGLPYRYSSYKNTTNSYLSKRNGKVQFETQYELTSEAKIHKKGSFGYWCTERYFFANKYLGLSFKGTISHKPWNLATAKVKNTNLCVLDTFDLIYQRPEILFCKELNIQTNSLKRI